MASKHLILVPGFVGFDAIGQLPYYAGVTELFEAWVENRPGGPFTIDYFDNFPTASVEQRAKRLRSFLAKKIARGQIGPADDVTLVGHSTGGLDIRRLLRDLRVPPPGTHPGTYVDQKQDAVANQFLRDRIKRIVYLSVPHYGTNIGDAACRSDSTIQGLARAISSSLALNRALPLGLPTLVPTLLEKGRSELFWAVADALRETDELAEQRDQADEREARFELALWLEHMSHDVSALGDLRSYTQELAGKTSPAHDDVLARQTELADYRDPNRTIRTLSYATRVTKALSPSILERLENGAVKVAGTIAPWTDLVAFAERKLDPLGALWIAAGLTTPVPGYALLRVLTQPARLFEILRQMCATGGQFVDPTTLHPAAIAEGAFQPFLNVPITRAQIGSEANDGIVNTLSMLWPFDPGADPTQHRHRLVEADHADIIGHHSERKLVQPKPGGRTRVAYDIFESGSEFKEPQFKAVWSDIFDFAWGVKP